MGKFSAKDAGVRVGLEIHQQLATNKKLFCNCSQDESDEYTAKFSRRLRISKSELGELDPAALFESAKSKTMLYFTNPKSSCLVERDEEPPHELDCDAKEAALLIASTLESVIFREIFPMRKTVIDGSNTTGFQRTMLISRGGHYEACGRSIGIQSVCLEEDAAKILGDDGAVRKYGLGRLGIPLVEIATEPFEAEPAQIKEIALELGRILRSTGRAKRGLGSIRQDVNVSVRDGGVVVEVKGVQQLDQLERVVEYEARRQHGLLKISAELRSRDWSHDRERDRLDVTGIMGGCGSKVVTAALKRGDRVFCMTFRNLETIFGFEPSEGIRLGKEVAELVKSFGLGGVFHSDELPNYGIDKQDIDRIRQSASIAGGDAFLVLAAPRERAGPIMDQIALRVNTIRECGIPADTRMATQAGQTRFLRPRPGAARMYPETDVPPIPVSDMDLAHARDNIPKPWGESIRGIMHRYGINEQLAEQLFDSEYMGVFERSCDPGGASPNFVASTLCSTITNLERNGLDRGNLSEDTLLRVFGLLRDGSISKETVEMILEGVMSGREAQEVIDECSSAALSEEELGAMLERIVDDNRHLVDMQGERASGPLMGIAMRTLRGKASGEKINRILQEKIRAVLNNNKN